MKYTSLLICLFSIYFCAPSLSQEIDVNHKIIYKLYPLQFPTEIRAGLEYRFSNVIADEIGFGYVYNTWQTSSCGECVFPVFSREHGKGFSLRNRFKFYLHRDNGFKSSLMLEINYVFLNFNEKIGNDYYSMQHYSYNFIYETPLVDFKRFIINYYIGFGVNYKRKYVNTRPYYNQPDEYFWPAMGISFGYRL